MEQRLTHYLLKGGRLIDPAGGRDGVLDVRVRDGRIDAVGLNLEADDATVIDAKDHIVTPGLIDVHLHLMKGLGAFGVDPDIFGVGSGVTTVVDAGSAGHTVARSSCSESARSARPARSPAAIRSSAAAASCSADSNEPPHAGGVGRDENAGCGVPPTREGGGGDAPQPARISARQVAPSGRRSRSTRASSPVRPCR